VLVSSAIFGLAHLFSLVLGRQLPLAGLTQIVYSQGRVTDELFCQVRTFGIQLQ
jgi:hypothetical protein